MAQMGIFKDAIFVIPTIYIGVITPVITGRGLPCMGMGAFDSLFGIPGKQPLRR